MRGQEVDVLAKRQAVLEGVFGRSRIQAYGADVLAQDKQRLKTEKDTLTVRMEVEETVHIGEERQWLGIGDDYGYGLGYHSRKCREKSDGLEEQIEKELASRGYTRHRELFLGLPMNLSHLETESSNDRKQYNPIPTTDHAQIRHHRDSGHSWWRRMYNRLSQSEPLEDISPHGANMSFAAEKLSPTEPRRVFKPRKVDTAVVLDPRQNQYEDPPPPSVIRSYKESRSRIQATEHGLISSNSTEANETSIRNSLDNSCLVTHLHHQGQFPNTRPRHTKPSSSPARHQTIHLGDLLRNNCDFLSVPHAGNSLERPSGNMWQSSAVPETAPTTRQTPDLSQSIAISSSANSSSASRSDSFLGRAFHNLSDASHSAEAFTASSPSSQSHESRIRLGGRPVILPSGEVSRNTPRIVQYSSDCVYHNLGGAVALTSTSTLAPGPSHSDVRASVPRALPDTRRRHHPISGATSTLLPLPVVKSRLRRDQIILPVPLAPAAGQGGATAQSPRLSSAPKDALPSQLQRSRYKNHRRHSYGSSYEQTTVNGASRRVSFPLAYSPVAEETTNLPSIRP
jgi:hypothetical protein